MLAIHLKSLPLGTNYTNLEKTYRLFVAFTCACMCIGKHQGLVIVFKMRRSGGLLPQFTRSSCFVRRGSCLKNNLYLCRTTHLCWHAEDHSCGFRPWLRLTGVAVELGYASQTWLWSLVAPQVRGFCARLRLTVGFRARSRLTVVAVVLGCVILL